MVLTTMQTVLAVASGGLVGYSLGLVGGGGSILAVPLLVHGGIISSAAGRWTGWLLLAGIVLFSGSLYLLAITGARMLGAVTPFGGVSFIAAWVTLAVCAFLSRRS